MGANLNAQEDELALQQALEQERFLQAERIRRARDEEDIKIMQEEIVAQEKIETGRSVGKVTFMMMVTVSLTFDIILGIISLIPYVGWIINALISVVAFMTFYMWFRTKGIKFTSPRKMMALPAGFLFELIPYLNILPGWTVAVFMTTAVDKIEKVVGGATK